MVSFLYFLLANSYVCLFVWGIFLAKKGRLHLTTLLLFVIIGLIYDNLIIAIGRFIGEGNVLESFSYVRFLLHALFTPTLILFAFGICMGIRLPWAKRTFWKVIAGLMTLGLILYELFTSVINLEIEPNWRNGVLTYTSTGHSNSPIMVITVTIVLGIVGFILAKKFHFYWLLIGTIVMISGGLLTIWMKQESIMNILELLLIVTLLMTWQFQVRNVRSQ
ncbi:hypothetical protein [Fredinandcohnia onubensis]|uniref:hypothetical protein n=1 Tax=Fredinandcohnia onubensis TaxID=1571209 RepID=UPI000C0BDC98|nr:hypothetical protein [Fredinandcohnia onubensis]